MKKKMKKSTLLAYFDGELNDKDSETVKEYLLDNPEASKFLEDMAILENQMTDTPKITLAKEKSDSILDYALALMDKKEEIKEQRIYNSIPNKIKRVKIADVIHNTQSLEVLTSEGIEKYISDAEKIYIRWAREIAPIMVEELVSNIGNYHKKIEQLRQPP